MYTTYSTKSILYLSLMCSSLFGSSEPNSYENKHTIVPYGSIQTNQIENPFEKLDNTTLYSLKKIVKTIKNNSSCAQEHQTLLETKHNNYSSTQKTDTITPEQKHTLNALLEKLIDLEPKRNYRDSDKTTIITKKTTPFSHDSSILTTPTVSTSIAAALTLKTPSISTKAIDDEENTTCLSGACTLF